MINLLILYLLLMLNIMFHELAHAIICILFNKEIVKIKIGEGISFHFCKFVIGFLPLRGCVHFKYESLKRYERYMIFLSGPCITIILFLWYTMFSHFFYSEIIVLQLIIQLVTAFLPGEGSDLSNAIKNE